MRERVNFQLWIGIAVGVLIIIGPMIGIVSSSDPEGENDIGPTRSSFYDEELDPSGGQFEERFLSEDSIETYYNSQFDDNMGRIIPSLTFEEDAEDLSDGQTLIGTNGWTWHDVNNTGSFYAAGNRPYYSPTPQAIRHSTYSNQMSSTVLTGPMDLTKISMRFYILSTVVDVLDLWVARISFIGRNTTNSTDADIAFSVGIKDTDAYAYNGQFTRISTQANTEQWYSYSIDVDCTTQKASITYYRGFFQTQLATLSNYDLKGGFQSIQRIEFMVQKRVNAQVSTYYDWIQVVDTTDDFYAITPLITLSQGMDWQFLTVDAVKPNDAFISFELLDDRGQVIPDLYWDPYFRTLKLGSLNDIEVHRIKIKGIFHWDGLSRPEWDSYFIDWRSENGWRDTFYSSEMIDTLSGCQVSSRDIVLMPGQMNGYYLSNEITIPGNRYWDRLVVNSTSGNYSFVSIDIVDPTTGRSIPEFDDIGNWSTDLRDLDPIIYPSIQIRAWINNRGSDHVELGSVGLTWYKNKDPVIREVKYDTSVLRTQPLTLTFDVNDADQYNGNLFVSLIYLEPGSEIWTNDFVVGKHFDEVLGKWMFDFLPNENATLGNYSFQFTAMDEMGRSRTFDFPSQIFVLNNIPTPPVIELTPENPRGFIDIATSIITESVDVERETLSYNYSFMVNGTEIQEQGWDGLTNEDAAVLPFKYFKKHDEVICRVHSFDGHNESDEYETSIVIKNDPPRVIYYEPLYLELYEDTPKLWEMNLKNIVNDRDYDPLFYECVTDLDIVAEFYETAGTIFFLPADNFTGNGIITINVSDGEENTTFNIEVNMFPSKDAPAGTVLSPLSDIDVIVEDPVNLTADVWDCDTEERYLKVEWTCSEEVIAEGTNATIYFNEPGDYEIVCTVDDIDFQTIIGTFTVHVHKKPFPYQSTELDKEYQGYSIPVVFDICDLYGNGDNVSNSDQGWTNITGLTSWTEEEIVFIEMILSEPGIPYEKIPDGFGVGEWGRYQVYFVKSGYSEPIFNQSLLNFYSNMFTLPSETMCYWINETRLCLSTDPTCPFEFEINGSNIVWKLTMEDLQKAGIPNDDYNLFGTSLHLRSVDDQVKCGFDTIGYGSNDHHVIVVETKVEAKEDGTSGWIWIVLILIVLILLAGIIAGVYIFVVKKKEPSEEVGEGEQVVEDKVEDKKEEEKKEVSPALQSMQKLQQLVPPATRPPTLPPGPQPGGPPVVKPAAPKPGSPPTQPVQPSNPEIKK